MHLLNISLDVGITFGKEDVLTLDDESTSFWIIKSKGVYVT